MSIPRLRSCVENWPEFPEEHQRKVFARAKEIIEQSQALWYADCIRGRR